ncbi:FtsK/SpoIIIE domain-containing protein [Caldibacillus lycopersici]|uniref:FtsK/SpoIIIE domain-containing protein n=1 Tax=Perspicuibacillus lycopersici TaxID=1325689 RepID=A0AAE3IVC9_9BACI|nr:FtsK/SpoIIIE domain-containing protein [Perspicuibacillus lycopersici]MCU9614061.1 FtsK/SpoIIIE domain-containing protein [Perspicuibacillus lycopersici]
MIFEAVSTIAAAGLAGYSYLKSKGTGTSDSDKIQKIFANAEWQGKKGESIRLQRKQKFEGGYEYVYQLPLGFDRKKIEEKKYILEDGLNVRNQSFEINFSDLKDLKFNKTIVSQLKNLIKTKRKKKEIEVSFDGMLKIKIYDEPMPNIIEWRESLLIPNSWSVPIGITRKGDIVRHDFDNSKHLIVAGATGYGKSVILKLIVTTLIRQQPETVTLSLIDLKGGSAFHRFKDCKQRKHYSRDPETAEQVLKEVQNKMNHSFLKVVDKGYEDVKEAGIKERHFIIIDEAADLSDFPESMKIITDIARRGRSAGYYLIFCTQYPTAQVIPSQTKRNIIARLCYVVDTETASRVVLDEGGAEQLHDLPGRGIYKAGPKRYTLQSPFISNKQIASIIAPYIMENPKDGGDGQKSSETTKNRKHSLILEEV